MRVHYSRGRTLVPKESLEVNKSGEVKTYKLPAEELAKYRALPFDTRKAPMVMPRRRKKA